MSVGRSILLAASRSKTLNAFALHSGFVKRATRRFMPGEHAEDALAAAADIDRIGEMRLPAHVSVKPTQPGIDLSIVQCGRHLLERAANAEQAHSTLWLDMEDSAYVDRTLDLYRAIHEKHPSTGLAVQAYLRRTPDDLAKLIPIRPMVRLVKGACAESARTAFEKKSDTDRAYYDLASGMLEGHTVKTLISYGSAWYPWYMRWLAERRRTCGSTSDRSLRSAAVWTH